jgi:cell division protein FtsQ
MLNVLLVVILAGSCWLAWQAYQLLTRAEMFQIAGVDVTGVRQLSDAELKDVVGPFTGQNVFKADLDAAVRRARANAWIRDVTIRRSLPNRISMAVRERVPFAVLDTDNGRYLIDNEAVVIDRVGSDRPSGQALPVIALRAYRPHPGETVTTEAINEALTLLAEIEARGGWNLADVTVKAASPESLALVYAEHEFRIGSGRYAEKLRRLAEVMADVKQRDLTIAYVDLRPEHQAAVMLREIAQRKAPNTKHQVSRKRQ